MNSALDMPLGDLTQPVADSAHEAVDKAAAKVAPGLKRATAAAHDAIDKIASAAEPATEWADRTRRELASTSTDVAEACSSRIRERPLASVVGALVLGYFVGRLLR